MPVAKPFVFVPPPWRGLARPAAAQPRSSLPATKSPMAPTKRVSAHPQASEASDSGDSELLGIDESRSVGSHEAGQAAATKRRKPCPENIGDGAETRCFEVRLCEEEEPKPALDEATARDEAPNESLANDFVCWECATSPLRSLRQFRAFGALQDSGPMNAKVQGAERVMEEYAVRRALLC